MNTTTKKRRSLSRKIVLGYVLLAALITAQSLVVGILTFKDKTISRYNTVAYQMSDATVDLIDKDDLRAYAKLVQSFVAGEISYDALQAQMETPEYQEYLRRLDNFRIAMNANDIMVAWMDRSAFVNYNEDAIEQDESRKDLMPMKFIFDSYYIEDERFLLGDSWYVKQEYAEMMDRCAALGEDPKPSEIIISNGTFGYTITSYHPVVIDDEVVAVVLIEIPMSELTADIMSFVTLLTAVAVILTLLILAVSIVVIYRSIVSPIVKIAQEADNFVSNNNVISGELKKIQTKDELQTLAESINQMQEDINEHITKITTITAEKERISAELDVATQIQANMLPSIFPAFPERKEFDIFATMNPAKEVGGDFYDFFLVDDDHLALVIADVSGKGIPAALFMMISKTLIKTAAQNGLTPKAVLEKVNNQLCENNDAGMFVTVWLGIMEISSGKLTCTSAGHEYPAIMRKNGEFELFKDRHGFVLAGMEGSHYREYEITLNAGDRLFVYTDGVAEATDAKNEQYGTDRMIAALNKAKDCSCKNLLTEVHNDIDAFVGDAPQFDDITMLCVEIKELYPDRKKRNIAPPTLESISEAVEFFESTLTEANVPMKLVMRVNVAVDEIFSNIARYSGASVVTLGCDVQDGKIVLRFSDNGRPYDPTAKEDPDITLSAEEREIGGLGIFMVKKTMDEVNYSYTGGLNTLTLVKML